LATKINYNINVSVNRVEWLSVGQELASVFA